MNLKELVKNPYQGKNMTFSGEGLAEFAANKGFNKAIEACQAAHDKEIKKLIDFFYERQVINRKPITKSEWQYLEKNLEVNNDKAE
jgi:hypothetical protein